MSRTANIASDAGIGIDRLLGYLATMGEVTQLDMGSIGNSMKTILSRMSAIKAGKLSLIDEDGTVESLSDVETVLNNIGIRLRDGDNQYRNFGDVLDETAAKWSNLSNTQQAAVAQAFAGTRMQNNFRVLMNNYDKATKYMNISADSAGTAEQKFSAYMDSLEAKSKRLQASFESLAVDNISTGLVGGIIDATTAMIEFVDETNLLKGSLAGIAAVGAIAGINKLVSGVTSAARKLSTFGDAMRLLKTNLETGIGSHDATLARLAAMTTGLSDSQLKAVLSSKALTTQQRLQLLQMQGLTEAEAAAKLQTMGLAAAEGTATTATFSLKSAFTGLWNVIKANPLIAVMAVVTAAVSIYSSYKQKIEETRQAHLEAGQAAREEANNIKSLYSAYENAQAAYDNNTGSKEDLESATSALIDGLGLEATEVDELTEKYGSLSAAIQQATIDSLRNKMGDLTTGYSAAMDALVAKADEIDGWTNGRITKYKSSGDQAVFSDVLKDAGLAYEALNGDYFYGINHGDGVEGVIEDYQRLLDMQAALEAGVDEGLYTRTELASSDAYNKITDQINGVKSEYDEVFQYIDDINEAAAQIQIMEWQKSNTIPETTGDFAAFKQEMIDTALASGQFVGSQEDIENAIDNTIASMSGFSDVAAEYQTAVSTMEDIQAAAMQANTKTTELAQGIGAVQDILGKQTTGKNLSLADYNSDDLKDYTGALEYHNGVMRLNADRVNEIIKAKAEEQKAINDNNKALAQSKYLENARQIESLRAKIREKNFAEGESEQSIRNNIAALQAENSTLKSTCDAYDLMNSSLTEATSAYNNWLNAQNASQAGEMFDSSLEAFKKIEDTLFNADSDDYGRIGNADYKAAIDFVIPDSVDSTDETAINSYRGYFTYTA